ncbi:bax inhibitor 1-like isoform X2 [Solanum dulcamara]|uniref:bax inhibitor 1-like isoform X2 n=1 Tax=Solanum dulcamara TaxID=45834 RepID=UPI0024851530|nr:bax inhibitor 1-like isoform X2 [Solanum dulcamara]
MNFSEAINAVKWYFNRNWNRDDMMNFDEIPDEVHRNLKKVYLTLFCAVLCSTFGSYLQWITIAGGQFTVLSYVTSLIMLYITPPGRVNTRFLLLMFVAYSFGASVSAFPNYLFEIKQRILAGITIGSGNLLYRATRTRERSEIYIGCLQYCCGLALYGIVFILLDKSRTALWVINIHTLQILFMGYLVIYSQEIVYDANFGDINFVNCTFTVFFHLPGIVMHAARLYLQSAEIEQHEQN